MRPAICLLVTFLLVGAGCGQQAETPLPEQKIRIASGLPGGVYRVYARAYAEVLNAHVPRLRASALTTEGSVENLRRLDARTAEVAFSLADTAGPAKAGRSPFKRRLRIKALARLYEDYVQVIARREAGLDGVTDLKGKTVSIGARGSGTALTAKRILKHLGMRGARGPRTLSLPLRQSADALAAGRIDAFFWSGGLPTAAIENLSAEVRLRLLALPVGTAAALDRDLYTETQIPQYVYDSGRAARTVAAGNLLVVREDLPEETAFRLTRALFEHRRELERHHSEARGLNRRDARSVYPLDLHSGAARWYRESRP